MTHSMNIIKLTLYFFAHTKNWLASNYFWLVTVLKLEIISNGSVRRTRQHQMFILMKTCIQCCISSTIPVQRVYFFEAVQYFHWVSFERSEIYVDYYAMRTRVLSFKTEMHLTFSLLPKFFLSHNIDSHTIALRMQFWVGLTLKVFFLIK